MHLNKKNIAVIALTNNGAKLALRIFDCLANSKVFLPDRIKIESDYNIIYFGKLQELIGKIWKDYDAFVFVMSTGIVVRIISKLLKDKLTDPAVLVIDELGKNVISLLSGHTGGANRLTKVLSEFLNANPVITTASDVNGILSFDSLAEQNNLSICNNKRLYRIASDMLNKKRINLFSSVKLEGKVPPNVTLVDSVNELISENNSVIISEQIFSNKKNYFKIIPKNLIVGIGCRKGVSKILLKNEIQSIFNKLGLELKAIKTFATIELKKDEKCINKLAEEMNLPINLVKYRDIKKIEDNFRGSEFVKKITSVKAVAEPSAYLSAKEPEILLHKSANNGITLAIVRDKSIRINLNEW